jgi:hypothetical protein
MPGVPRYVNYVTVNLVVIDRKPDLASFPQKSGEMEMLGSAPESTVWQR